MLDIHTATQQMHHLLQKRYSRPEAANIITLLFAEYAGMNRVDRHLNPGAILPSPVWKKMNSAIRQIGDYRPVQYVLGWSEFCGYRMKVNERVMIPRPETEELATWIIENRAGGGLALDFGTGCGCIAIALKKHFPSMNVCALDISSDALGIARENAILNKVNIDFFQCDMLNTRQLERKTGTQEFDLIVSNPPYIPQSEKALLPVNVAAYEPGEALFVSDDDRLLYYRSIAAFAQRRMKNTGYLYFEINESFGDGVSEICRQSGFKHVVIRKDLNGKERMVRAHMD